MEKKIESLIKEHKIIAILRGVPSEKIVDVAKALYDGIFEKISDDRDIVFDRKKKILFQTAAVRGDGEQDAEFRSMHHFSDHKGANL